MQQNYFRIARRLARYRAKFIGRDAAVKKAEPTNLKTKSPTPTGIDTCVQRGLPTGFCLIWL
jgi:hypothetical protein